jgi:myo-inositol-1(or 4)-monophosphatase
MKELAFLKEILPKAYSEICKVGMQVSEKAEFDVVTNIDRGIEEFFKKELEAAFPGDFLLGEEYSPDLPLLDRTWILDPIDGTYNFSTGSPNFALQAAFWDQGALHASVIYLPKYSELYEATLGGGAFCNGKRLFVSNREVKNSIVSFGDFPPSRPNDAADQQILFQKCYRNIARTRMFGSAAIDFTHIASAKTEGVVLFTQNKWDIAPGLLLVKEAGALCFGMQGEEYSFSSRGIFACNSRALYKTITGISQGE